MSIRVIGIDEFNFMSLDLQCHYVTGYTDKYAYIQHTCSTLGMIRDRNMRVCGMILLGLPDQAQDQDKDTML